MKATSNYIPEREKEGEAEGKGGLCLSKDFPPWFEEGEQDWCMHNAHWPKGAKLYSHVNQDPSGGCFTHNALLSSR